MIRIKRADFARAIESAALCFNLIEEPAARGQPQRRHIVIRRHRVHAHAARQQVLVNHQRSVARAEKAGRLAVQHGSVVAAHERADLHPRR